MNVRTEEPNIAIARKHPFVDGNKRSAYVTMELFIRLNGCRFLATDADAAVRTIAMAGRELTDDEFTDCVREFTREEP